MASNNCLLHVTDRNSVGITIVEVLIPYDDKLDCVQKARQLSEQHKTTLYKTYPAADYYIFTEWLAMNAKARSGKGSLDEI